MTVAAHVHTTVQHIGWEDCHREEGVEHKLAQHTRECVHTNIQYLKHRFSVIVHGQYMSYFVFLQHFSVIFENKKKTKTNQHKHTYVHTYIHIHTSVIMFTDIIINDT